MNIGLEIILDLRYSPTYFEKNKSHRIDSPGHRDYIANAIGGQSQADVALLLVPSSAEFTTAIAKANREENVVAGQSRTHARLVNLLGVKQLIVGINKMDTTTANCQAYSEERFNEVKDEIANMLVQVGWNKDFVAKSVPFIPYSAWKGDNMVKQTTNMPWWKGQDVKTLSGKTVHVNTLMEALNDYAEIPKRAFDAPFRMPVSQVITTIKGIPLVVCGKIEQGALKPGDEVVFLPKHTESNPCTGKIFSIEMHRKSQDSATVGDNVGCCLKGMNKDFLPEHGNIMVLKSDSLRTAKRFTTQVQILDHPGELYN